MMTRAWKCLAAVGLVVGLGAAACGDDDDGEETPPSTGETGVDGSEADAGDPSDDTITDDDGGSTTGGGTQGNQELDTPAEQGDTQDTARGGAG